MLGASLMTPTLGEAFFFVQSDYKITFQQQGPNQSRDGSKATEYCRSFHIQNTTVETQRWPIQKMFFWSELVMAINKSHDKEGEGHFSSPANQKYPVPFFSFEQYNLFFIS